LVGALRYKSEGRGFESWCRAVFVVGPVITGTVAQLVGALRYKPAGRGFESWC